MRFHDRVTTNSNVAPLVRAGTSGSDRPDSISRVPSVRRKMPRLRARRLGEWTVVELMNAESLNEHRAICEVSRQLHRLVNEGQIRLLVNLGGVRAISGEVLATLAGLYRVIHSQHGRLALFGLQPLFRDMLRICHLDRMVEIYGDESEAVDNFGET